MYRQNISPITLAIPLLLFHNLMQAAEHTRLGQLVVTGTHTPVTVAQMGSSVTIIHREQIEKRQSVFVHELLRDVPGFAVSRAGARGSQTQIRLRGAEANQLLVLIDGIEANDIAGGDEFDFASLMTTGIERIEIIRGPQSALYGSDAMSGVINIITRKGSGPIQFTGYTETGSFGSLYGMGNVSTGNEHYHFNIAGSRFSTAGTNISRQGHEDDGYDNDTVSFQAGYKLLDELEFYISGRHTETDTEFDGVGTDGLPTDALNNTVSNRDYLGASLRLSLLNGDWEHMGGFTYTGTDNDSFSAVQQTSSYQGQKLKYSYQTNYIFRLPNIDALANTLTFAVDYEKDGYDQNAIGPAQHQTINNMGYVLGYRLGLWESMFLSASVRKDDNSRFDDKVTYRVTSALRFAKTGTGLHAAYGTGVKRPTFIELFGFQPDSFIGNPNLKPETSHEWEVGFDQALLADRISLAAVYFNAMMEDEVASIFGYPTSTVANLSGVSKRQGVEMTASLTLTDSMTLTCMYTWNDATQPNEFGRQVQEVRRPRNMAGINLDYLFLHERANVNLNINHTGSQDDTYFNPRTPPFGGAQTVGLDSYTLVNLTGSYQYNKLLQLNARIENLLNDSYEDIVGFQAQGIGVYVGINLILDPR